MLLIISLLAKCINLLSKAFKKGSGLTLPGYILIRLFPDALRYINGKYKYIVLVTGTNGKTTTTKLIYHLLSNSNKKILHNASGANLITGILTSFLLDIDLTGKPKSNIAIFEVDEFSLPVILKFVAPSVLVLLNLSRDQLDRYGETDVIFEKWLENISFLPAASKIVYYVDQPEFRDIKNHFRGTLYEFTNDSTLLVRTKLSGDYNAKNINAAVQTCLLLNEPLPSLHQNLATFEHAYGRGETIEKHGKSFTLYLAKNPASFNHNLQMISELPAKELPQALFFILNDNIPDGRDVSWIYDIDPILLKKVCNKLPVVISGTRYLDMAIRLQYAGVDINDDLLTPEISQALLHIKNLESEKNVLVLPNYSAMLDLRKILLGRSIL